MRFMLGTIISFCSNDLRYLSLCLEAVRPFSDQILICVCDHFFDGTEENYALLEKLYSTYDSDEFVEFVFDKNVLYGTPAYLDPSHPDYRHHWHNTSRLVGTYFLRPEIKQVLFCDVDEIIDTNAFHAFLQKSEDRLLDACRFSSYFYFRHSSYRALTWTLGPILVKKQLLSTENLLHEDERSGLLQSIKGNKKNQVLGLNGLPMVHHYSWVRTEEEMVKKTKTWGHYWEREWQKLIEKEFSQGFQGKDFIASYDYEAVDPVHDPLKSWTDVPESSISLEEHRAHLKKWAHVHHVDAKKIERMELLQWVDQT